MTPCGQRRLVKRVALFGSGEPGVLTDGPWFFGVHGGVRASGEREDTRQLGVSAGGDFRGKVGAREDGGHGEAV